MAVAEKEKDAILLSRFLRDGEMNCVLTRSPDEALQKLQSLSASDFDVLLLVPAVDGFDAEFPATRIQEAAHRSIPTISVDAACHLQTKPPSTSASLIRLIKPLRREPPSSLFPSSGIRALLLPRHRRSSKP